MLPGASGIERVPRAGRRAPPVVTETDSARSRLVRLARRIPRIRGRLCTRRAEHGVEDRRRLTVVALRPFVPPGTLFLSHAPSFCDGGRFRSGKTENRPPGGSPARRNFLFLPPTSKKPRRFCGAHFRRYGE
jgi:hypothetical protein